MSSSGLLRYQWIHSSLTCYAWAHRWVASLRRMVYSRIQVSIVSQALAVWFAFLILSDNTRACLCCEATLSMARHGMCLWSKNLPKSPEETWYSALLTYWSKTVSSMCVCRMFLTFWQRTPEERYLPAEATGWIRHSSIYQEPNSCSHQGFLQREVNIP